ncbi:MAG: zinc-ribbon domain-containing protein [Candidatus Lokiarchaeota archaeon]|nr:zinc-ribbon domain-containing protein [Candidatus Lokiarchaeota archaeon]MBD3199545.1 zinc-ribbon domain-containing protein [Candidatus Lokiarchaeota archaeon]
MSLPPSGTPIIIDLGSAYVKVGFAGESEPRYIFPCITGTEKYTSVMVDVDARNVYVGEDAMRMRGVLKVSHPIQRGNIMDWDEFYQILNHIFYNLLRIESFENYPILYVEAPFVSNEIKEFVARVLYETHQVKSIIMVPSPILSCFSVGLTTGLIIESGDGTTWIVPIINGQIIYKSVQRLNLAGMDISHNLKSLMMREGISLSSSASDEIIKELKEKNCYFVLDPDNPPEIQRDNISYPMPDGSTVEIPHHILYEAPEVLFEPTMIGSNSQNVANAVISCLQSIDRDYWGDLLSHIVLSGGNLMHSGFEERLKFELDRLLPQLGEIPKPHEDEFNKNEANQLKPVMTAAKKDKDNCPKCGTLVDLSDGKTTCPQCDADLNLPQISLDIDSQNPDTAKGVIKCPLCNKEIKDKDSAFCPYCGFNLEDKKLESAPPPKSTPTIPSVASEFEDSTDKSRKIIKFFVPNNLLHAIFNGAAILGSLPSFRNLFITQEEFQANKDVLYRDISQVFSS